MSLEHPEIIAQDRQVFYEWAQDPINKRTLPTDPRLLRYLIPPRLYELASDSKFPHLEDPSKIKVAVAAVGNTYVSFFIAEEKAQPITNKESLDRFERTLNDATRTGQPVINPDIPDDVDEFHRVYPEGLQNGTFTDRDFLTHEIELHKLGESELYVLGYIDRGELRGMGVARSFYQRLREVAGVLNFRYITGDNNESTYPQFFTEKLGRVRFRNLSPRMQHIFQKTVPILILICQIQNILQ